MRLYRDLDNLEKKLAFGPVQIVKTWKQVFPTKFEMSSVVLCFVFKLSLLLTIGDSEEGKSDKRSEIKLAVFLFRERWKLESLWVFSKTKGEGTCSSGNCDSSFNISISKEKKNC